MLDACLSISSLTLKPVALRSIPRVFQASQYPRARIVDLLRRQAELRSLRPVS